MSELSNTHGLLEMPCLGRPFQLGTLYDCRNDSLIPGVTLWGPDTLGTAISKPMETSDFEVITEDSLNEKTLHLDVSAGLKLSVLGGLVKAGGSGKFLYDRTMSKNQARVSLKYKATSKYEELNMRHLGKFEYPRVFEDDIATHVVTGVQYGADFFFVFDRQVDSSEKIHEVHGNMEAMISVLPSIDLEVGGSAELDLQRKGNEVVEKIQCKFYGDFILPKNPTTYQDAVRVYQELPNLLGGAGYPKSVPKKVWLYPLSKLDTRVQRMVREISSFLIDDLQEIMESLHEFEVQINDLIRQFVCLLFIDIKSCLEKMKKLIGSYRTKTIKSLSTLLPMVRGGGEEETKLAELLEINKNSPFSCDQISSWICCKEEVAILGQYLIEIEKYPIKLAFSRNELIAFTSGFNADNVLCFDFNIPSGKDVLLQAMEDFVHGRTVEQNIEPQVQWSKSQELREQLRRFLRFVSTNANREGNIYVVTNHTKSTSKSNTLGVISRFVNARETEFEPPDQPDAPQALNLMYNSFQLNWDKPKHGIDSVQSYTVSYRSNEDPPDQWNTQTSNEECLVLTKLTPGSLYHFKVTAESAVGSSPESKVGEARLPLDPPGKPSAIKVSCNSLQLEWARPKQGANILNSYSIYYRSEDDPPDQWSTQTSSEESLVLTKLTPGSLYHFKVQAESALGSNSESEVGEVRLPPDQPGKPHAFAVTHNSLQLKWTKSKYVSSIVNSYTVSYRSVDDPPDQWSTQTSSEEYLELTKLTPGSLYHFKITAESFAGLSPESEVGEVRLPPDQPGKPQAAKVTYNSLQLNWSKPKNGIVNSYAISYHSENDLPDQWSTKNSNEECLVLTELTPGSLYHFKITAESFAGLSPESEVGEVRLPPDQPGKPQAAKVTYNSLQLNWSKPKNGIVNSYVISYHSENDPPDLWSTKTSSDECLVLTKLTSGSLYRFKVTAKAAVGSSPESEIGEVRLPPDQPGKPQAAKVTYNSLQLNWSKPKNGIVNSYVISYHSENDPPDQWSTKTSSEECLVLTELTPGSLYHFKVTAKSNVGSSPESEVYEERLPPDQPGKPQAAEISHNSIQFQWTKPKQGSTSITSYTLLYRSNQSDQWSSQPTNGAQESALLTGLNPTTTYHIKVQAVSCAGSSPESEVSDPIETLIPPPGKPNASLVTHNSLSLFWNKPEHGAESVVSYTVFYCVMTDSEGKWFKQETNSASGTIHNLTPNTSYLFKIRAETKSKCSLESEVSDSIRTMPPPPGKIVASDVTCTSVVLKWEKQDGIADYVKSYTIYHRFEGNTWWNSHQVGKDIYVRKISKLSPGGIYYFKIVVETTAGPSPDSEECKVLLLPDRPGKPYAKVTDITPTTIQVQWSKPSHGGEHIKKFTLWYRSADDKLEQWSPHTTTHAELCALITDLSPKMFYYFKAASVNDSGVSQESEISDSIETLLPPPGKPYATNVTHNSVTLKWEKPEFANEKVLSYSVFCFHGNSRVNTKKTNGVKEILVWENLAPKTSHEFKVRAETSTIPSPDSDVSDPIETMLPPPTSINVSDVTHSSLCLNWKKLEQKYAKYVHSYMVLYCTKDDNNWKSQSTSGAVESLKLTDLCPGNLYRFKVKVESAGAESGIFTALLPPAQPGKPCAIKTTPTSIHLQWTKPSFGALNVQKYIICYQIANGNSKSLSTTYVQESFILTGLLPNTTYRVKIQAVGNVGTVGKSPDSELSDPIETLLPPPGIPYPTAITHNSVTLNWEKPKSGAKKILSYTIFYSISKNPSGKWHMQRTAVAEEQLVVVNLAPKTVYYFKIIAETLSNSSPESEPSNPVETRIPPPGKPIAEKLTHNSVFLSWEKPDSCSEHVRSYTVFYRFVKNNQSTSPWNNAHVQKTSTEIQQLHPNTAYVFKVRGETIKGPSSMSELSDSITTLLPPPGKPHSTKASYESFLIEWEKPKYGNIKYYYIWYQAEDDPPHKWSSVTSDDDKNSYDFTNANPEKLYVFKVAAVTTTKMISQESEHSDPIATKAKPWGSRLLSSCKLISKGDPRIYQLPLHNTMTKGDIMKVNVGNNPPTVRARFTIPVKHKVLMVVGATGAGKSTLINGMTNYIMGVDWKDEYRFKLISEETAHDQTKSQTKGITAYTFHKDRGSPLPYTLTVIDTPGFGDTRGLERDKQLVAQIKEFFSLQGDEGIDQLHGIGFVTQAPLARLTQTQQYVFDSILSVFGKNVADNIFLMITFADGSDAPVLDAARAAKVPFSKDFNFNNSALFASNNSSDKFKQKLMFWEMGKNSFEEFFTSFSKAKTRSLQQSREVLQERELLEITIQGLQPQIRAGLNKIDALQQESRMLREHEADIIANKKFTCELQINKQRKIDLPTGHYVTNCLECNFTCHDDCAYANDEDKFKCWAMNDQGEQDATCRICPNKCSWREHYNNPYRFELYQETEIRTSDELKTKYDSAMNSKSQVETVMKKMEAELKEMNRAVLQKIEQARRSLQRLKKIALRPDYLTHVEYIDLLIQSEKQEAQPGWSQRVTALYEVRKQAEILSKLAEGKGAKNPFFPDSEFLPADSETDYQMGMWEKFKAWWKK